MTDIRATDRAGHHAATTAVTIVSTMAMNRLKRTLTAGSLSLAPPGRFPNVSATEFQGQDVGVVDDPAVVL